MSAEIAHLHAREISPDVPELSNPVATGFEDVPAVMSPKVLAELIEVSPKTLERWRDAGTGPLFLKLPGSSLIRYSRGDVVAWLIAARAEATS